MAYQKAMLALVAGAGLAISATSAGADGPRSSWSGFYFGGNVGWARANVDQDFISPVNSTVSASQSTDFGTAGVHFGFQQQYGSFVLGVEGALSGVLGGQDEAESNCSFPVPFQDRCDLKSVGGLGTLGLRLGWAPSHQWMLFASGGLAQAHINTAIRFGGVGVPPPPNAPPVTDSTLKHHGYYLGGGVEYAVTNNWVAGFEYQHVFLGDEGHCVGNNCSVASILNRSVSADIDIVRFRLSYKFGGGF